jgi:hypothetical protein
MMCVDLLWPLALLFFPARLAPAGSSVFDDDVINIPLFSPFLPPFFSCRPTLDPQARKVPKVRNEDNGVCWSSCSHLKHLTAPPSLYDGI